MLTLADVGDRDVLTLSEAAEILEISLSTAKKLAVTGEFPGVMPKLGRQWRISRTRLAEFIHSDR